MMNTERIPCTCCSAGELEFLPSIEGYEIRTCNECGFGTTVAVEKTMSEVPIEHLVTYHAPRGEEDTLQIVVPCIGGVPDQDHENWRYQINGRRVLKELFDEKMQRYKDIFRQDLIVE